MTRLERSLHSLVIAAEWLTWAACVVLFAVLAPQGLDDARECTETEEQ